jgi:hypothetical protein
VIPTAASFLAIGERFNLEAPAFGFVGLGIDAHCEDAPV